MKGAVAAGRGRVEKNTKPRNAEAGTKEGSMSRYSVYSVYQAATRELVRCRPWSRGVSRRDVEQPEREGSLANQTRPDRAASIRGQEIELSNLDERTGQARMHVQVTLRIEPSNSNPRTRPCDRRGLREK